MSEPITRRQRIAEMEKMLASGPFAALRAEIERQRDEATREACDLDLSAAKRDGAAGARSALEKVLEYPAAYLRALEAAARKEKRASSPK